VRATNNLLLCYASNSVLGGFGRIRTERSESAPLSRRIAHRRRRAVTFFRSHRRRVGRQGQVSLRQGSANACPPVEIGRVVVTPSSSTTRQKSAPKWVMGDCGWNIRRRTRRGRDTHVQRGTMVDFSERRLVEGSSPCRNQVGTATAFWSAAMVPLALATTRKSVVMATRRILNHFVSVRWMP
jgi:hypothetical protein